MSDRPVDYGANGDGAAETRNPWACAVLHKLLDKYEVSAAFIRREPTTRRIQVNVTDAVVPQYKSGGMDPEQRREFHDTLHAFVRQGMITLDWVRFERGNLLARVVLQWDGIERAYEVLGRAPKADELAEIEQTLATFSARLCFPWMRSWLLDVNAYLREQRSVPRNLLPPQPDRQMLLLQALAGLVDKGEQVLPMRLFSKRYLRNSKAFEQQVRKRFVSILRQYWLPAEETRALTALPDEDAALLAEVGISVTHEDVAFCGPLTLCAKATASHGEPPLSICDQLTVHGSAFPWGLALDAEALEHMEIVALPVRRILTIENKANYRHYIRHERCADELVVYLGGFPSPGMRRFLLHLREFIEQHSGQTASTDDQPVCHHWGDLDYGGILIYQTLHDSVWPQLHPWRMEPEWLDRLAPYVEPFDAAYGDKLKALLNNPRYVQWHPLIHRLLAVGGTLEQEAFLV